MTQASSSVNRVATKAQEFLNLHVLSAVVLVVVLVGAVKSVAGDLSYQDYVKAITGLVGLTAIGRGLAAYKK